MQIDELDDQWHRHLHRSEAPQREGRDSLRAPSPSYFFVKVLCTIILLSDVAIGSFWDYYRHLPMLIDVLDIFSSALLFILWINVDVFDFISSTLKSRHGQYFYFCII
uniref:Ion transport domain-containing protein n=1 Tax=Romanomermis culicivorax TaxID=13658 RepID=A0A915JII5_ROMCU